MIRLFKNRRPKPVPQQVPADPDIRTAYYWDIPLDEWEGMTDFERAECRRTVTTAPRFAA